MKIEQFEDKGLAQYSYAVLSECAEEIVLIDPARNPEPYYNYAKTYNSRIVGVILTHSHADFVSSHAEIHRETGATVFVSSHMKAQFPHKPVDEGSIINIGKIKLKIIYTPGHSLDSISVLLEHDGKDKAIFTGDTLFIGDVGRPDLRGSGDNVDKMRRELAREMYFTIHDKLKKLSEDIIVYPGHGAGTLCGKSLSSDPTSSIGREKRENYAFKERSEESFINILLENQPFIPPYFSYDVALNTAGAADLSKSLAGIKALERENEISSGEIIIDTRPEKEFKESHFAGAINIQNGSKFETWLGTIVLPEQKFILVANDKAQLEEVKRKSAKIGYEVNIKGTFIMDSSGIKKSNGLNVKKFKDQVSDFTIIDVRNPEEVAHAKPFKNSINIPLPELQKKIKQVPAGKPIVVHCAGGYRSAIGASILEKELPETKIYDLSEAIKEFQEVNA